jgi:hypothetical protein
MLRVSEQRSSAKCSEFQEKKDSVLNVQSFRKKRFSAKCEEFQKKIQW